MKVVTRQLVGACGVAAFAATVGVSATGWMPPQFTAAAAVSATFTVLHAFGGTTDGAFPAAGLVQATDGTLYGLTSGQNPAGGQSGSGTVYKIASGVTSVVHAFNPCTDPVSAPQGPPIRGFDGNLYGTTQTTCAGSAALFKVTPAGAVSVVHQFNVGSEGGGRIVLAPDANGSFYGTASSGGTGNSGAALRVNADGTVTVLRAFGTDSFGGTPTGGLVAGRDGTLYGANEIGGFSNAGTVFAITPDGTISTVHTLNGTTDGGAPSALVLAADGNLYGTARTGGTAGKGTFFSITPSGTFTVLHSFSGGAADGATPTPSSIMQATDGNFYGTTRAGGSANLGVIYQMTLAGVVSIVHAFAGGADGADPEAGVLQANDGSLYGTTELGGSGQGTVFNASMAAMPLLPAVSIRSTSTAAPMPLTPLNIKVTGVIPCSPVYIQFSDGKGFNVIDTAVRLAPDGSVVAAVPVYVDPVLKQFTDGNVSVSVIQGGRASAPVNVTIQALPSLSAYGLPLGKITKNFLNFQAQLIGSRINELQALSVRQPDAPFPFTAIDNLQQQLNAVIAQRSDVDRLMANNALSITVNLNDGTTVSFDRHSLELMDRVNALYLAQLGLEYPSVSQPALRIARPADQNVSVKDYIDFAKGFTTAIEGGNSVLDITKAFQSDPNSHQDVFDRTISFVKGGVGLVAAGAVIAGAAGITVPGAAVIASVAVGMTLVSVANNAVHILSDEVALDLEEGIGDTGAKAAIQKDIADREKDAFLDLLGVALGGGGDLAKEAGKLGTQLAFQSAEGLLEGYKYIESLSAKKDAETELGMEGQELNDPNPIVNGAVGETITVDSTLGENAPLPEVQLCPQDGSGSFNSFCVSGIASPDGDATVFLPLGVGDTDYGTVHVDIIDPESGLTLGSEIVDLSGMTGSTVPTIIAPITVGCVDDDAGAPDDDDPDCDSTFLRAASLTAARRANVRLPSLVTAHPVFTNVAACSDAPSLVAGPATVNFAAINSGGTLTVQTPAQPLQLSQTGAGLVAWTASADQPWVTISPTSGTGSTRLSISINNAGNVLPATGSRTATITVNAPFATANPTAAVKINLFAPATTTAPFGAMDTPTDGTTGVAGSLAVTGWALDDVGVARVTICRDLVSGEPLTPNPNCGGTVKFYIGDAVFIDGARPDVQGGNPAVAANTRAGWGYLLLTNFLPSLGNGTFKISAFASDADGHATQLGTRTITCANNASIAPFGAIDTPGQGEVVSGAAFGNFGWVLSPGSRHADPPNGGSVSVIVDGVAVGSPGGWTARADLTSLFPQAQFSGISTALAIFGLDTTQLSNGLHTIAWSVTATSGGTSGVGSRFFTVSNGSSLVAHESGTRDQGSGWKLQAGSWQLGAGSWPPAAGGSIMGRRGFDLDAPFHAYEPSPSGQVVVQSEELDRIELQVHAASGVMRTPAGLAPLPHGSTLDPSTGTFIWMPGPGYVGSYTFSFAPADGASSRDVIIVLNPKGSNRVGPQTTIDAPVVGQAFRPDATFLVGGWAIDLDAPTGTGVDAVHVWAYPLNAAGGHDDPRWIGAAVYGGGRPDVAGVYGAQFEESGYGIAVSGLAPGTYDLAVFAYSTVRGGFVPAKVVRVTVH